MTCRGALRLPSLLLLALVVGALGVLGPTRAAAQNQPPLTGGLGADLHLFRPAIDSKGLITLNGSDVLGANAYSFGLILDGGFGIYPYTGFENDNNTMAPNARRHNGPFGQGRLVDVFATGTLHFNYGIENLLVVGVQLPIQVVVGPNTTIPSTTDTTGYNQRNVSGMNTNGTGLSYQGLGNITIHGKIRILRAERDPIGLAASLNIELPTGRPSAFAGEPGPIALWPAIAAEYRPVRQVRLVANLGFRLNFGDQANLAINGTTVPGGCPDSTISAACMGNALNPRITSAGSALNYGPLMTFGIGAGFRLAPAVDLDLEVYGANVLAATGTEGALAMEGILGLKIFVERSSYLLLGGGAGLPTNGWSTADVRAFLGFIFEPSIGDRDGDGLRDDVDQCPDEPEDFDDFDDLDGCPDPDNDRDGILDIDDQCPLVPEDRDGDSDEDGCPEGNTGDRDGDGILDDADQCPDDPEDRDDYQDEDGCPEPDNDSDGILDRDDLCPNNAEDIDQFEDEDGCPEPDNDRDRILDNDDACRNEPETYNGTEDEDGCPDRGSVVIEDNQIIILEKIYFETDSAEIQARSFPIIDAVAATLQGNPQIQFLEIQGHADERGNDDHNLDLTRDRAASVLEAMLQRGVSRDRMRSAGYGERCPVDPRSSPAAWDQNRRVEFKILRTDAGPTGVEVACPAGQDLIPR